MKINPFIVAGALFLTACGGTRLLSPTEADLTNIEDRFAVVSLDALNEGKSLYQEKCSVCHALKAPANYTDDQWAKLVPGMAKKAMKKNIEVNEDMQQKIMMYLMAINDR